jgi:hypothetical protein
MSYLGAARMRRFQGRVLGFLALQAVILGRHRGTLGLLYLKLPCVLQG